MRITGFVVGFGLLAAPALGAPLYSFQNFDIGPKNTVFAGINGAGEVSGYYATGATINFSAALQGFVRSPSGTITLLSTEANPFVPGQVNDAGQVAGTFQSYIGGGPSIGAVFDPITRLFTTVAGSQTVLEGINNIGQVTGFTLDNAPVALVLDRTTGHSSTFIPTTNVLATEPYGINDKGLVVGQYQTYALAGDDRTQGFVYDLVAGTSTLLTPYASNPAGSRSASARGVTDAGVIVGCSVVAGQPAFIRDAGANYSFFDDPAATGGTCASSINAAGVIAGFYTDAAGTHGFIATPAATSAVPEPAGVGLLLLGFVGAGVVRLGRTTSGRAG